MTPETQDQPANVAPPETKGGSTATIGSEIPTFAPVSGMYCCINETGSHVRKEDYDAMRKEAGLWELRCHELLEVLSPFVLYAPAVKDKNWLEPVLTNGNSSLVAGAFQLAAETQQMMLSKQTSPNGEIADKGSGKEATNET
jgi:hypothetical protein